MRMKLSPLAAAVAAVTALSPLAAGAQTQSSPPATAAPAPAVKAQVSDQQISQAAVAMQKVMTIRQTYNQKLTQAKPEDRGRIADESQIAMQKAVTDQGLSVEQYNAILQLAQNDPGVREKLLSRLPPPNGGAAGSSPSKP